MVKQKSAVKLIKSPCGENKWRGITPKHLAKLNLLLNT